MESHFIIFMRAKAIKSTISDWSISSAEFYIILLIFAATNLLCFIVLKVKYCLTFNGLRCSFQSAHKYSKQSKWNHLQCNAITAYNACNINLNCMQTKLFHIPLTKFSIIKILLFVFRMRASGCYDERVAKTIIRFKRL